MGSTSSPARIRELRDGRAGPLREGFADELYQIGYARKTAREHICAAEHFIYWTDRKALTVATLNDSFIDGFGRHLVHGCRCPGYRRSPWINLQNGAPLVLEIPPGCWCRYISSVATNDRRTGFADGISAVDASTTRVQCCDTAKLQSSDS